MDIGRALTFVTTDSEWIKKLAIAAAFILASIIVPVIGIVASFVVFGYCLALLRNVYLGTDTPLPEWDNPGEYLVRGAVVSAGVFIWTLPLATILTCVLVGSFMVDESGTFGIIMTLCLAVPVAVAFYALIIPILVSRYAIDREFGTMFQFAEILADARRAIGPLVVVAILALLISTVATTLGLIACVIGVLFTIPWSYLVIAHLYGQMYRQARGTGTVVRAEAAF